MSSLRVESALRTKNQITVPDSIVKRLGLKAGDRLLFVSDEGDHDVVHLHRLRESYAGALAGIYGETPEELAEYLQQEREAWGE